MAKIYHFNPSCEMEVANRLPHFTPPKQVKNLLTDGEHLPVFFTENDDRVLVNEMPSKRYLQSISQFGFDNRQFVPIQQHIKLTSSKLTPSPWGWSPSEAELFKTWFPHHTLQFNWHPSYEHWYRRETSAEILKEITDTVPANLFPKTLIPEICTNIYSVEKWLEKWGKIVIKAPLSSSGRGVQFLRKQPLNASNKQWIQGVLDQQGCVMVERMLDRVLDFSFHFYKDLDGVVTFVGETAFLTNNNGKYRGNYIGSVCDVPEFPAGFDTKILEQTKHMLRKSLQQNTAYQSYSGYLGVDMLIYREGNALKLHPCVEINARLSMGLVAIHLQKWMKKEAKSMFLAELKNEVNEQDFFLEKDGELISRCYWPLTDYWQAKQFVFMLQVK